MPAPLVAAGLGAFLGLCAFAVAREVPPLRGRVNDYAGLLPPERARQLEDKLEQFERETGHQVALLTVRSLEGDSLEDFSIRVAERWKVGRKGFDNGVILLVAREEKRLRLEVGYGLEGVLPDAIASRIVRDVIVPRFRAGDYAGGIEAGIDAIFAATRGETLALKPQTARRARPWVPLVAQLAIVGLLLLLLFAARLEMRSAARGRGGVWSPRGRRRLDDDFGFWAPSGGSWGGGGLGGGGGFSGGGGGFGGGGASGSW